jgi:acyl carrier protein
MSTLHATFRNLNDTSDASPSADRFEDDIVQILKRISRRPIEPRLDHELLADLGFDSLEVLELVGEIEEHFHIAVPLSDLSRIRTVAQVVAEVRALATAAGPPA